MSEPIFTVTVEIKEPYGLAGEYESVNFVPFSARAQGRLFNGVTVEDGIDLQFFIDGKFKMSARYMLEGKDFTGNKCRLFIENEGETLENCTPRIVTDSEALKFLQTASLYAKGESLGDGAVIHFYCEE